MSNTDKDGQGMLTGKQSQKLTYMLDEKLTAEELLLLPYISECLIHSHPIKNNWMDEDKHRCLNSFLTRGWFTQLEKEWRAQDGTYVYRFQVTKQFWDAMNEVLWMEYVEFRDPTPTEAAERLSELSSVYDELYESVKALEEEVVAVYPSEKDLLTESLESLEMLSSRIVDNKKFEYSRYAPVSIVRNAQDCHGLISRLSGDQSYFDSDLLVFGIAKLLKAMFDTVGVAGLDIVDIFNWMEGLGVPVDIEGLKNQYNTLKTV